MSPITNILQDVASALSSAIMLQDTSKKTLKQSDAKVFKYALYSSCYAKETPLEPNQ